MIRRFFEKRARMPLEQFFTSKLGPTVGAVVLFFLEVAQVMIISAAIILPIRYFLVQPFYVKGASMEPSYYDHEYLIIDELSYRLRDPMRGEVVVFRYPLDPSQFFIKRIVGLPGETVEINNGHVTIYNEEHPNGEILEEEYLHPNLTAGKKMVTLGTDEYYVLGDNRDESMDSRKFGPITQDEVIGRVWIRGLPISRIEVMDIPVYKF
ncbi:TPA: signal peptidase I [Candidatus Uhrbacteria bacterium]|uniref:Signal peptidase I n=2 Tax=Candidatus Uhriibacteriota TaxID=1752732 RepID=A0A0G1T6B9_9BACT|nr:MAG: Signal peptidase I [Candidatus Uhrbacteria bacterium GW2011_GWF2_46_218]KKU40930.1 MAG: Signal peptidase I [Candidatus Uhrbacteria bacterium GW2011_GWE2_46_68]HBK33996.1 signal peptidase I [Candidatus Uhrbacteria bacterium]HCB19132.1 signal peptidase I [Candidatus Uhrbacteria bacterium]